MTKAKNTEPVGTAIFFAGWMLQNNERTARVTRALMQMGKVALAELQRASNA